MRGASRRSMITGASTTILNVRHSINLFTAGLLLLQNSGLEAMDFLQDVNETYSIDTDGPIPTREESVDIFHR